MKIILTFLLIALFSQKTLALHQLQNNLGIKGQNFNLTQLKNRHSRSLSMVATTSSASTILAKVLGYSVGLGSLAVHTPIIIKLLRTKNPDGFSLQTWIFSLFGMILAIVYPFQKGFQLSTYLELVILSVETFSVLGILCFLRKEFKQFLMGTAIFFMIMSNLFAKKLSPQALNGIQLLSTLACNYASVPQVILTFREKRARWSPITSILNIVGCIIRIFTTMNLASGDVLFLIGYITGLIMNVILLIQTAIYPS